MSKKLTIAVIAGVTVCVIVVTCVIGMLVGRKTVSTTEAEEPITEMVIDTTAAQIDNVDPNGDYYGWTVDEINSVIYNYAGMVDVDYRDVSFTSMDVIDDDYYITFSTEMGDEYTIILDSERYLKRVSKNGE